MIDYRKQQINQLFFEEEYINMFKNDQVYALDQFLSKHKNKSYDTLMMDSISMFKWLGKIDVSAKEKNKYVRKLQQCFDNFCDRSFTNFSIIESIKNDTELDESLIKNFGLFDCKIDGTELVRWLYQMNKTELLATYINIFRTDIPKIIHKLSMKSNYSKTLLKYLQSQEIPLQKNEISDSFEKIILYTEYGVSVILYKNEIKALIINELSVNDFLISQSNYVYKLFLTSPTDMKLENTELYFDLNDITQFELVTKNRNYRFEIPWFSESQFGINYLQRYSYENELSTFEYDYNSLNDDFFKSQEFGAVVKSKLHLPLNHKLTSNDLIELEALNCYFDERFSLYSLEDVLRDLEKMPSLSSLRFFFENKCNNAVIDMSRISSLKQIEKISICGSNITMENLNEFEKDRINILTKINDQKRCEIDVYFGKQIHKKKLILRSIKGSAFN